MKSNPISLITAMLLFSLSLAGQNDSRYDLLLKSGSFTPQKNITADKLEQFNHVASRAAGKTFAVIQFENIPTGAEKKLLHDAGIELLEYVPNNAYTVTITGSLNTNLLTQVKARAIVELSAEQKMQPELAKGNFPSWAVTAAGTVDVWISFPKSFIYETITEELKNKNFDIISDIYKNYRIVSLRVAATRLKELASMPFVEYVQPIPHEDQPLNSNSMFAARANMLKAPLSVGGRALKGSGVAVGIGDNGDVQAHIDFNGRLISRAAQSMKAHATHVTGTIGGAGIIQELYTGYAPKATLINQFYSNIILNAPTYVKDYGMVVTNNSYGTVVGDCEYNGLYDLASRIVDQQAFDLPELQNVFAAGNDGTLNCAPYPVGFKTVLGGFQSAKNVLTVGSTNYKGDVSLFSSKGPVKDGRIKPEIMSQGEFVISTWANDGLYSPNNGTSMATPGVSGGLALLIERYRQLNNGANPPSALLKAFLCNGGTDKGNAGPDYSYGFGTMNLLRSVTMIEKNSFFKASVASTLSNTHSISVPANTAQLKVTLYWQDPPANLLATKTLVNDLDLEITAPATATVALPKILDTIPANVVAVAGTGADHINNIEQVVINNP
ncbi:MAG: S8 family serine peptidase, partial [Chitinophagaceae bacterium]